MTPPTRRPAPPPRSDVVREISRLVARDRYLIAAHSGEPFVESPADKADALADAAKVLEALRTPYMLIGGVAVAVHAQTPRATLDVDFAVRSDADRDAVAGGFEAAGFSRKGRHAHTINLRHRSGEPIQLAFDPMFDAAIGRAETLRVGPVDVRIVRREDLIELKERAAADPRRRKSKALRDRADAELLRGGTPDADEGW